MGVAIKQTETFRKWRTRLKDNQPCIDRFPTGSSLLWSCGGCRAGRTGDQRIVHPYMAPGTAFTSKKRGETIIVLLCGGDKSTQAKDIEMAKRLGDEWSE